MSKALMGILSLFLIAGIGMAQDAYWVNNQQAPSLERYSLDGELITQVDLPGKGFGLATAMDSSVWVAISETQQILHINAEGEQLASIDTQSSLRGIALAADGTLWVTQPSEGQVSQFKANGILLNTFAVGILPNGIAAALDGSIWVSNSYGSSSFGASVSKIDSATLSVSEHEVSFYPTGVCCHPDGSIWVASKNGIEVLDSAGQNRGHLQAGLYPRGIAVSANGDVWVANYNSDSVSRFSVTQDLLGTYDVGEHPWGVSALGNGDVLITSRSSSQVHRLNSSGQLLSVVDCPEASAFGDMTGLVQTMIIAPSVDADGDGSANDFELSLAYDPLSAASKPVRFLRGDATGDQKIALDDLLGHLRHVSMSIPVDCPEALDVDNDGSVDLLDSLAIASYLFQGGPAPAAPFPAADYDPNPSSALPCEN